MKKFIICIVFVTVLMVGFIFAQEDGKYAKFEVNGDTIIMTGVINTRTPKDVKDLIKKHPNLNTIIMKDVPGSIDDIANLETGRLIRKYGLNTHVPRNGIIASGGTDLFCAGVNRTIEEGAKIGVHSWSGNGIEDATILSKRNSEHQKYIEYYKEMGIPEDFYWFTINAAPASDIYMMNREEMKKYKLIKPNNEMEKNNNQIVENQLKITDYFMLLKIPYSPLNDGYLSKAENQELLKNRILKLKNYPEGTIEINKLSDKEIELQGRNLDVNYLSRIKLFSHENGEVLIGREISFAQQNLIELFSFDSQKKELILVASTDNQIDNLGILPKFNVNDFLSTDESLTTTDGIPIIYYFESDDSIMVEPYTWMKKEFENRTIKYTIHLKWNGKNFEVVKKVIKEEITNPNYKKYVSEKDITRDTSKLGGVYKKYYSKYIQYMAPNGKPITIVAQDKVTDEQVLKAYNQLSFYLENFGSYKKVDVANKMAENGAILVMPNGADGQSDIPEDAIQGQPLYQMEVQTVGGKWYTENDYKHRDAAYEEILHMVQDYGIGLENKPGALPDLQKEINKAMKNSLPKNKSDWGNKGLWGLDSKDWLLELEKEGSLEQEYLASVVDSYYGLWAPYTENKGGMWGIYTSKTRDDIKKNDPMGYKIVSEFLPSYITYMARIDSEFSGTFKMYYDEKEPYTHKSKYLKNARLLGNKNTGLIGNSESNILMGNGGNNEIDGKEGLDIVQFTGASVDYKITKKDNTLIAIDNLNRDGIDTLRNIEVLRFTDNDIIVSEVQ